MKSMTTINDYTISLVLHNPNALAKLIYGFCDLDDTICIPRVVLDNIIHFVGENNIAISNTKLKKFQETPFVKLPTYIVENQTSISQYNSKTLNGYPFDLMKSAIQKYTRRGDVSKLWYSGADMELMRYHPKSQAQMTNFFNRLKIIYLEDIGLGCIRLIELVDKVLKDNTVKDARYLNNQLPFLLKSMALCTHTRAYSAIRASMRTKLPTPQKGTKKFELGNNKDIVCEDPRGNLSLETVVESFIWSLENKDRNVWYWGEKIMEIGKLNEYYYRNSRPGFLIFAILYKFDFISDRKTIDICFNWYKDMHMREQFLCPLHATCVYVFSEEAVWEKPNPYPTSYDDYYNAYNPNLLNHRIIINDYVYDKHTRLGKQMKRGYADFKVEGALVAFDIDIFPSESEYYREYDLAASCSSETKEFKLKSRAQVNTSGSKPDTYFASNKNQEPVVVKGPYRSWKDATMPFKIQSVMKLFEGVNTYDVTIKTLFPDMFETIPLGARTSVDKNTPYYFVVMEDVMGLEKYPIKTYDGSGKLWQGYKITDYEKIFSENTHLGFATPSLLNDAARFSLLIQIAFRLAFQIGDIAIRNFVRYGDQVYNIDTEGIMGSNRIAWKKEEKEILLKTYQDNTDMYSNILQSWLGPGDSYIDRWYIVERTLTREYTSIIKENISGLLRQGINYFNNF